MTPRTSAQEQESPVWIKWRTELAEWTEAAFLAVSDEHRRGGLIMVKRGRELAVPGALLHPGPALLQGN